MLVIFEILPKIVLSIFNNEERLGAGQVSQEGDEMDGDKGSKYKERRKCI